METHPLKPEKRQIETAIDNLEKISSFAKLTRQEHVQLIKDIAILRQALLDQGVENATNQMD